MKLGPEQMVSVVRSGTEEFSRNMKRVTIHESGSVGELTPRRVSDAHLE